MFKVKKSARRMVVETGNAVYEWDAARGGQLTGVRVKDGGAKRVLVDPTRPAPNLTLKTRRGLMRAADYPAKFDVQYEEPGYVIFSALVNMGNLFTLEQTYEVFRESVVFCEFRLLVNEGRSARISAAELGFDLDLDKARNVRTCYASRDQYLKQDVTTAHVLATIKVAMERNEKIESDHLLGMVGIDVGWGGTRCYSNRVEFVIEDNTSIGGGMRAPTRTLSYEQRGRWIHKWQLAKRCRETFRKPFFYRNKWALFISSARTEAGPNADPVRRNNVLGARVCHVMYPYIHGTRNWPWCSVPMRQTFYDDVQIAKEDPPLKAIDQAAKLGANVLLIHQFWMTNGGSNGEPMADYTPYKPKWLKAFIARAHKRGMRVLLYARGIEMYFMYMNFFEKYLKKDWDGIYMDWAIPFSTGYTKSSYRHSSVYNYFMFTRALRKRVGENGVLIGHSIIQAANSYAAFDGAVTGEFSVLHSGLLEAPLTSASYAGMPCVGAHLIAGNSPDRAMFSGQRAAGVAAGLGWANHPFMEPGKDFANCSAFTKPLWDMINSLSSDPVRVFNPAVESRGFAKWSNESLWPIAYKDARGNVLVIVANLSEKAVSGSVEIDPKELGLRPGVALKPLKIKNAHVAKVAGNKIVIEKMAPYFFCGVMISRRK
jgi:hypothetical protein